MYYLKIVAFHSSLNIEWEYIILHNSYRIIQLSIFASKQTQSSFTVSGENINSQEGNRDSIVFTQHEVVKIIL